MLFHGFRVIQMGEKFMRGRNFNSNRMTPLEQNTRYRILPHKQNFCRFPAITSVLPKKLCEAGFGYFDQPNVEFLQQKSLLTTLFASTRMCQELRWKIVDKDADISRCITPQVVAF